MNKQAWGAATLLLVGVLGMGTGCPSDDVPTASGNGDGSGSDGSGGSTTGGGTPTMTMTGVGTGDGSATGSTGLDSTGIDPDSTGPGATDSTGSTGPADDCGNGELDGEEECDGDELGGEDCTTQGLGEGTLACDDDCTFDTSGCMLRTCGNDALDGTEVCDGTELDGEDCTTQGFDTGTLACLGDCTGFDTSGCMDFPCGDDMTQGSEVCDGTDLGGEDCTTQGFDAGVLACLGDCSGYDTAGCTIFQCGDDMTQGVEVCDGTDLGGEDCLTQGFDAGVLACLGDCSGYDTAGCIGFGGDCCLDNGTPGCDDPTCTADVCAADPFCCDTSWDGVCAGAAFTLCPVICDNCGDAVINSPVEVCDGFDLGGQDCTTQGFDAGTLQCLADCSGYDTSACIAFAGDCCVNNGTPGCDDPGCTTAICLADPFCCTNQWDAVCAAAAVVEPACQGVGGSCPNPMCGNDLIEVGEQCDGLDLGGEDCSSQGFGGGNLACLGDCSGYDTSGCVNFMGDCCANNGSPGCDDPGCTAAVCAVDPFCCSVAWDATCAGEALVEPACQGVGGSCPDCGNDVIDLPEVCDGLDLGGETCASQGFDGGTLGCAPDCSGLDTSGCANQGFGDCVNNPPAAVCLPEEQCITDLAMPPTQGVCTDVSCVDVSDCPLPVPGGTAPVQCVDITGEGINECIMFCGLPGLVCPPGMICALGIACAWPA